MTKYTYKGFNIAKGRDFYIIGNEKNGQIAPNDQVSPRTLKECRQAINSYLNSK